MHVADIDGRIYERRKREQRRELAFALLYVGSLLVIALLCLGGGQ